MFMTRVSCFVSGLASQVTFCCALKARRFQSSALGTVCVTGVCLALASPAQAGASASGAKASNTDYSNFTITSPGAGTISNYLTVPTASTTYIVDPGAPAAAPPTAPAPLTAPFPKPPFVRPGTVADIPTGFFAFTARGLGVSKPKSTTVVTSDAWGRGRVETATGIQAFGSGAWYDGPGTGRLGADRVDYAARADIIPIPVGYRPFGPYQALSQVQDPVTFTSAADNMALPFTDTLNSLSLDFSSAVGTGPVGLIGFEGYDSSAMLDGGNIYDLSIYVPSNFAGASDIKVNYSSIRGSAFDSLMTTSILDDLAIDPGAGTVTLDNPLDIFPSFGVPVGRAGTHVYQSQETVLVAVDVPEASPSLLCGCAGLILLPLLWQRSATARKKSA